MLAGQVTTGGVVSLTVMVCAAEETSTLPHGSTNCQVMVLTPTGRLRIVTVAGTTAPITTGAPPFTLYCSDKAVLQPAGAKVGAAVVTLAEQAEAGELPVVMLAGAVIAQALIGTCATDATQPVAGTDASERKRKVRAPVASVEVIVPGLEFQPPPPKLTVPAVPAISGAATELPLWMKSASQPFSAVNSLKVARTRCVAALEGAKVTIEFTPELLE